MIGLGSDKNTLYVCLIVLTALQLDLDHFLANLLLLWLFQFRLQMWGGCSVHGLALSAQAVFLGAQLFTGFSMAG